MRSRISGPENASARAACPRTTAGITRCLRHATSKQSAKPFSHNGGLVESASRALKSYTFSGALCPARANQPIENKALTERRYRKKYGRIFKPFVFNDF